MVRLLPAAVVLMMSVAAPARAEWQIRPFLGMVLGSSTTFEYPTESGAPKLVYGASAGFLGDIFGVEADFSRWSGYLLDDQKITVDDSVTTLMGNVTVALPRRLTEYTLRPYFAGGAGLIRVSNEFLITSNNYTRNMTGMDLGAGVTGFLTRRVGVNWDVRHFRAYGLSEGDEGFGFSLGQPERLSFWRVHMALAIRY
jgi:opacity protein-like surface antigen